MTGAVEVTYQSLGDCLIVRVAGDVDNRGASVLRDCLVGKASAGDARLVVDLSRVGAMDIGGLSALEAARQEAEASGGSLRLVGVGPTVRAVLKTADKTGALAIDDDMSDALEATMQAAAEKRRVPRQSATADVSTASREIRPG
jgi:anti-sigma B factor antagonist